MLIKELRNNFRYMKDGDNIYKIQSLDEQYPAYVIKDNGWYGVAIELKMDTFDFFEKFESVRLVTKIKNFSNRNHKMLELITDQIDLYEQFASICADFIVAGENGENRKTIEETPAIWWNKWKRLLGNKMKNETNYSLLAELLVLNHLMEKGEEVYATNSGTHDIETKESSFEVKSTIERYALEIHINSQYQLELNSDKPLKLIFVRLEPSRIGYSIENVLDSLKSKGYDIKQFEERISNIGTISLEQKYRILEAREFNIDDKFPKITLQSFKDNTMPVGIKKMEYIVELEDLEYEAINLNY